MSALAPGARRPRSSRPRAADPPTVAARNISPVSTARMLPAIMRARTMARRISSTRLWGGDVGAQRHVDLSLPIAAEVIHRLAVAGKGGGAMGDRCPGIGETVEIAGAAPPDVRVLVDEQRVPEDGAGTEKVDAGCVLEWRLAVPAHDFLKFESRLREVGGERASALARVGSRVAQRRFGAGLDLARIDDAAEPAARVLLRQVHDADGVFEVPPPSRLVPVEHELVPVLELPVGVGEEGADVDAKSAPARAVEPSLHRCREIDHGGDAAQQQLRVGHLHRCQAARRVEGEGAGALVEPGVVHLGDAVVLSDPLEGGFGVRMRMDVDEARHHEATRAVDAPVGGALPGAADMHDAIAGEGDVSAAQVVVPAAVPRRNPGRIADDGGVDAHGFAS